MKKLNNTVIALSLLLFSCEKYLDINPPDNRLETSSVFSDSTSTVLAIQGIYSDMMGSNAGFVASQMRWGGLSSDELVYSGSSIPILQFFESNLLPDNSNLNFLWSNIYKHIYQVNSIIEGVENSSGINSSAKNMLIGEAKFVRAFLFFYAANNWGDIPLTLSTDYQINESMPRIGKNEVYEQIKNDLIAAIQGLPSAYLSPERVRPNKLAAIALLARINLYGKNWQEAIDYATQLISSKEYYSLSPLEDCFLKESRETIWQFFPATLGLLYDTYDGNYFVPSSLTNSSIPSYLISDELYSSFEEADKRKENWIGTKASAGNYHFPYKYKEKGIANKEYTIVLRLSEQYLIRAEALAHLGNLNGAIDDLNTIRERAGLKALITNVNQGEVLRLIEEERHHELFCEWDHRWSDLRRTDRVNEVLQPIKGNNWQASDALWPIPLNQLLNNSFLTQNDGY